MRKGGAGKANWGSYKDELNEKTEGAETEEAVKEEEVDDSLTLSELMGQKLKRQQAQKVEKKLKSESELDLKSFKKENCQLVSKKADIDDYVIGGKKTTKTKEHHKIGNLSAENELLGLRTGLKTYTEKPEGEREERAPREQRPPREERPKREHKKSGEVEEKKEGYKKEAANGGKYQKEGY